MPLHMPRDRAGTFEPLLVLKYAGRVAGGSMTWWYSRSMMAVSSGRGIVLLAACSHALRLRRGFRCGQRTVKVPAMPSSAWPGTGHRYW
jgi:hypothetical protein